MENPFNENSEKKSIDYAQINALWEEFMKGAAETFIDMHIGKNDRSFPKCYGNGPQWEFCRYCVYHHVC